MRLPETPSQDFEKKLVVHHHRRAFAHPRWVHDWYRAMPRPRAERFELARPDEGERIVELALNRPELGRGNWR